MPRGYFVYTSNCDGQFQKTGFSARKIAKCHGSIHHLQCLEPFSYETWPADDFLPDVDEDRCQLRNDPPSCKVCGGPARPNILMFSDWDWREVRTEVQTVRLEEWLATVSNPIVIEIGAGTAIPSVRHFSHRMIQKFDATLIRIDPDESDVPGPRHVGIKSGAMEALEAIASSLDVGAG